tara:strand:- start:200 stop:1330 length:1131 start_codon:yes stop_codon:yes gene_type:complete
MKLFRCLILGLLLLCSYSAFSQVTDKEKAKLLRKIEREKRKLDMNYSLLVLPAIYYTPETNLAGGVTSMITFKSNPKDSLCKTSQIIANAIYTLNDQILLNAPFQVFLDSNKWYLNGELAFYRYPYVFGGIGNDHEVDEVENYSAYFPRFNSDILRRISGSVYGGGNFFYQNTTITEVERGGLLDSANIPGAQGSTTFGIGLSFFVDTRNDQLLPTKGWYVKYSTLHFTEFLGSNYAFNQYTLDARWYKTVLKKHSVALNLFTEFQDGDVPFNRLSPLGGPFRMRGYLRGNYRDKQQAILQAEFRSKQYWHHVAFRLFSAIGGVGDNPDVIAQNLRPTVGAGFRFTFKPDEKLYIRVDYGVGQNTSGFYVNVGEAF